MELSFLRACPTFLEFIALNRFRQNLWMNRSEANSFGKIRGEQRRGRTSFSGWSANCPSYSFLRSFFHFSSNIGELLTTLGSFCMMRVIECGEDDESSHLMALNACIWELQYPVGGLKLESRDLAWQAWSNFRFFTPLASFRFLAAAQRKQFNQVKYDAFTWSWIQLGQEEFDKFPHDCEVQKRPKSCQIAYKFKRICTVYVGYNDILLPLFSRRASMII